MGSSWDRTLAGQSCKFNIGIPVAAPCDVHIMGAVLELFGPV